MYEDPTKRFLHLNNQEQFQVLIKFYKFSFYQKENLIKVWSRQIKAKYIRKFQQMLRFWIYYDK